MIVLFPKPEFRRRKTYMIFTDISDVNDSVITPSCKPDIISKTAIKSDISEANDGIISEAGIPASEKLYEIHK